MSEAPKIVQDRLRASAATGAHPDADVLTAFAEQVLSGTEREEVVRHLSRCADCREVVALGLPPMDSVAESQVAGKIVLLSDRLQTSECETGLSGRICDGRRWRQQL